MIQTIHKGSLEYLAAEGISVPHAFTTRFGGVSTDYLSSLNLAPTRGDDPENVVKNYEMLGDALALTLKMRCLPGRSTRTSSTVPRRRTGGRGSLPPGFRTAMRW